MWRNSFGRGFGPVVWQITDDDDCNNPFGREEVIVGLLLGMDFFNFMLRGWRKALGIHICCTRPIYHAFLFKSSFLAKGTNLRLPAINFLGVRACSFLNTITTVKKMITPQDPSSGAFTTTWLSLALCRRPVCLYTASTRYLGFKETGQKSCFDNYFEILHTWRGNRCNIWL